MLTAIERLQVSLAADSAAPAEMLVKQKLRALLDDAHSVSPFCLVLFAVLPLGLACLALRVTLDVALIGPADPERPWRDVVPDDGASASVSAIPDGDRRDQRGVN